MDEKNVEKGHCISINDRKYGKLTGINNVISFDPDLVVLITKQGKLTMKGKELHVIKLDVERGEIEFSGRVDSIIYTEIKTPGQVTTGIIKRMFK